MLLTLFLLNIWTGWLYSELPPQNTPYLHLEYGTCWDLATGVDVKSSVYAIINDKKIKLGDSDDKGKINLKVPINTQFLIFESEGYETVKRPVSFIGKFSKQSRFGISVPMTLKGSDPTKERDKVVYFRSQEPMIFCAPETPDQELQYELYRVRNRHFITKFNFSNMRHSRHSYDGKIDHYLLVVKDKKGQILGEKDFVTKDGFNLIDLHIENISEAITTQTAPKSVVLFDNRTVYFDQSSHDLTEPTKQALDSIAAYLISDQSYKVTITGYTDNVGKKELNMTLSEYRARVVASYLQTKGALPEQMIVSWKGPEQQVNTAEDSEKYRNRRVVIQSLTP